MKISENGLKSGDFINVVNFCMDSLLILTEPVTNLLALVITVFDLKLGVTALFILLQLL